MIEQAGPLGHVYSISAIIAAFFGWLPPLAAFIAATLGAVYYGITIYESQTFQQWRKARKLKHKN